ncbi:MAG: protein kinase [Myxococcales bacterium]|nr:protein kinase [Myxococcales bacterium]
MQANEPHREPPPMIDGRYRVEAELGHGGMGRAYRCVDERSGQGVALKQLRLAGDSASAAQAMFRREYHTLAELRHPHIIRVLDFGVDDGRPYYTMELLDGEDAATAIRARTLTIREICILLRDTASALALVHSRRMVHRDVSSRNVWRMPDGRAKLIDFGTLVAMGPQSRITGTPPFVPPEAMYLQPLDARSDLYSLGAVAYHLLTLHHAYPAHRLTDLRQLWDRRPKTPAHRRADVPAALSELVQGLLSLDPRGRPSSAAEVYQRLSAIAELPPEDDQHCAQAFLNSPQLVGRHSALATLRKRVKDLRDDSRGGVAAIVGHPGLGRSRMLASVVLETKLLGAAAISVDAAAVGTGPLGLIIALAERLIQELPLSAAASADRARVLAHASPALRAAFGNPPLDESTRSGGLSAALVSLFKNAVRRQPLMIAIDGVHRADGASLAVLGQLCVAASRSRLLLVVSSDQAPLSDSPPALAKLLEQRNRVELGPLQSADTLRLLESLFGQVPGLQEMAEWVHGLSGGSPGACMQYAQYLVDRGVARYDAGRWKLPVQLRDQGLPDSLSAMLADRLSELSQEARRLALGLALARDETRAAWQPEQSIQLEDFPKLLHADDDDARTFRALDELLQIGLLEQRDSYYVLGQRAIVDSLLQSADAAARREQHLRLAEIFSQPNYPHDLAPIVHLQHAGEDDQACQRHLARAERVANGTVDWKLVRLSLHTSSTLRAFDHWQATHGPARDGVLLRRMLLLSCPAYDWSLSRFGAAQLAQARADSGLLYWDETDPAAEPAERAEVCLRRAKQAYEAKPEHERCLSPAEAVGELATCALTLGAAAVNSHDLALARELLPIIAPLRALSPMLDLVADLCELSLDRLIGRRLDRRMLQAADRALVTEGMPDVLRMGSFAVLRQIQGLYDARFGRARALTAVSPIEERRGKAIFLVAHVEWLAHAFRGHAAEAARAYKHIEVITEDDVWRRKAHLFAEAELHALTGNLLALTRVREGMEELAERFPGWRPWLAYARGMEHWLRGDLPLAGAQLDAALLEALPGEHRAWGTVAPARALLRLACGDVEGALDAGEAVVRDVRAHALEPKAEVFAERVQALALSARGEHVQAKAALQRAFALASELELDGLPLATLFEASARIGLAADDFGTGSDSLQRLRDLLEHADAPALVAAYEALRQQTSSDLDALHQRSISTDEVGAMTSVFTEVSSQINASSASEVRCRRALELVLEDMGLREGHLFLVGDEGAYSAASIGARPDDMLELAERALSNDLLETKTEEGLRVKISDRPSNSNDPSTQTSIAVAPIMLAQRSDDLPRPVGVILHKLEPQLPKAPNDDLLHAIAQCLVTAGDTRKLGAA